MEKIIELDKKLLLFLNSFHAPWLDPIMLFITHTTTWIPLYLFLVYLISRDYKKEVWIILLGIVLTILLADQITASIMKPYFERWRPSREPTLQGLVHLVDGYVGGKYGFASSHAANTFGTATFFFLLYRHSKKWIVILFLWAAVMTYTRIYLGVHYPGDILVGGIIGVLSGIAGFRLTKWIARKRDVPLVTLQKVNA
ncbi:phosphatase PAP2 family protein [Pseudochryseolinea flava]|uniref:Phosphatase PAP2 family protein n=1 Tax=Pseudochryseolinea flava TaxID=2059302 RepID=A0A364XWQ3_9BACT|nr:phosphatase PAP2 family protein [Pseudochryseolinea flava]RAV98644.1 phosphatase PAP2 family protein [Pseudochryseolinea flava]